MIKSARARHETGMRFQEVVVTGPGYVPDALGERWSATARNPAGLAR